VIDDPIGSVVATSIGSVAVSLAILGHQFPFLDLVRLAGLLAIIVTLIANTQVMARFSVQPGSYLAYVLLALATAVVASVATRFNLRGLVVVLALTTALVGSLSVLVPNWEPVLKSDVYRAHEAAGMAMLDGENPYSDAVVFESGDPNKPDGTLVFGYPYPPPPLLTYGLSAAFTDPRLISVVSWFVFIGGIAWVARGSDPAARIALGALVLLATMPIWRTTLFMAWTEPLSIALLGGALLGIRRGNRWGWILLGVALASKQYLVFLAPLVVIYRDSQGRRPGWWSIFSAGIVAALPALFGPADYFRSIIGNTLGVGIRPDSQSINGAIAALGGDFVIPMALAMTAVGVTLFTVWKIKGRGEVMLAGSALTLAILFLVTSAFPNYWLLVAGITALAVIASAGNKDGGAHSPESMRGDVNVPT
jgi:hypothetical protein